MFFKSKSPSHLPFPEGNSIPGIYDVMTGCGKNEIFLRLYYPTDLKGHISNYSSSWIPWIPEDHYLRGLSKVVMVWETVLRLTFWLYSGYVYVPVVYGAKPRKNGKMKCIILSHGLGANRFFYSTMCTDLASRGFLVAAIEHRDESSCSTYYYEDLQAVKEGKKTLINYIPIKFGKDHLPNRKQQIKYRSEECEKAVDFLFALNNGQIPKNILDDVPGQTSNVNLKMFEGKLNLADLTMMGHSFGGATSIFTLHKDPRLKQGIVLDPWMFPIKDDSDVFENIKQPILFINTQTFHIASNVKTMEKLLSKQEAPERKMFTILHTTHESQCDSPFVCGYWLNWFMKKLDPVTAFRINTHLILSFLNKHIVFPEDITTSNEYLLHESHNFTEGLTKPWI